MTSESTAQNLAKPKSLLRPYVVWSYVSDEPQLLIDVVMASSKRVAKRKVARGRPYAKVLSAATLLEHVEGLVGCLARSASQTEKDWRELIESQ
jgi:hypothetical protein